jgi:hypothetical protein
MITPSHCTTHTKLLGILNRNDLCFLQLHWIYNLVTVKQTQSSSWVFIPKRNNKYLCYIILQFRISWLHMCKLPPAYSDPSVCLYQLMNRRFLSSATFSPETGAKDVMSSKADNVQLSRPNLAQNLGWHRQQRQRIPISIGIYSLAPVLVRRRLLTISDMNELLGVPSLSKWK